MQALSGHRAVAGASPMYRAAVQVPVGRRAVTVASPMYRAAVQVTFERKATADAFPKFWAASRASSRRQVAVAACRGHQVTAVHLISCVAFPRLAFFLSSVRSGFVLQVESHSGPVRSVSGQSVSARLAPFHSDFVP